MELKKQEKKLTKKQESNKILLQKMNKTKQW
jgi:hypothetical protein